jgi:hypothetical protein
MASERLNGYEGIYLGVGMHHLLVCGVDMGHSPFAGHGGGMRAAHIGNRYDLAVGHHSKITQMRSLPHVTDANKSQSHDRCSHGHLL